MFFLLVVRHKLHLGINLPSTTVFFSFISSNTKWSPNNTDSNTNTNAKKVTFLGTAPGHVSPGRMLNNNNNNDDDDDDNDDSVFSFRSSNKTSSFGAGFASLRASSVAPHLRNVGHGDCQSPHCCRPRAWHISRYGDRETGNML